MALRDHVRRFFAGSPPAEWSVFHGGEHVCDLVDPAFDDMFWVSYRLEPRIEADRMFLILERALIDPRKLEFGKRSEPHHRAEGPFLGADSVRTMRQTGRLSVRALR